MATYELIQTVNVTSTVSQINFTSIPSTYTDLYLWINVLGTGQDYFDARLNTDSSSIYTAKIIRNDSGGFDSYGSSVNASQFYSQSLSAGTSTNSGAGRWYISDYANTTWNKAVMIDAGGSTNTSATAFKQSLVAGNYGSNSAINAVNLISISFAVGTVVSLYGIKNT